MQMGRWWWLRGGKRVRRWSERKSTGVAKREEDKDETENKKKKASARGHDGTESPHRQKTNKQNTCGDSETGSIMTR